MAKPDTLAIMLFALAIGITAIALCFSKPNLTGAVVAVPSEVPLDFVTNESTTLDIGFDFDISSLKLSGNFSGDSFEVYLNADGQRYLVANGQNESTFSGQCIDSCEMQASPPYALDIIILNNGTLQLSNLIYSRPELVTEEVAEKVEPAVLAEETADVVVLVDENTNVEELIDAGLDVKYEYKEFNAVAGTIDKTDLDELAANPDVEAVKADAQFQITLSNSVPFINAPKVWQIQVSGVNVTGSTETVCVIDTGTNYSHPALAASYLGGFDFVNNDSDPMDDHNHGTHVAGIVLSNDTFYRGVAPGAKFVTVKAFNSGGGGSLSDILAAMDWCVANKDAYNISIMSMSFGDGGQYGESDCPTTFDAPINAAIAAGITPVAASGNNGYTNGVSSPACGLGVIAVGAVNNADSVAGWSNSGTALDLLAPGVSIMSAARGGGFMSMSGTSMATPHVSGVVALLQHYNKLKTGNDALTPAQVEAVLEASGVSVTDPKNSRTTPRIDAFAAIASSPIIIESPLNQTYATNKIDFNATVSSSASNVFFSIDNGANNAMTNDSATHWYNNSIENLTNGTHNATFYVTSDINNSKTVFFSIIFDTTPPQIILNSPANSSILAIGRPVNLTVTDNTQVQAVWYEKNGANTTITSSGNSIYLIPTTGWTKGLQNITAYANDTIGNSNISFFSFNADSAPTASSVAITPASPNTNDNLVCSWVFSDPDNDTESNTAVKWFTNNAENATFSNLTTIDKSYTVKGQQWKCQITPSDGLVSGTAVNSSAVTIQNSPPIVDAVYPSGGEKVSGVITLNASASDADGQSDIQIVRFYYSSNSGSTFALAGNDTAPSGNLYEFSWNTSKVTDGKSYRIKAEAQDSGSTTAAKTSASNFAVNNVNEAPAATVIAPNGGETWNGSKSIKWNATDPDEDTLAISIYCRNSSNASWAAIVTSEFNTGSYTWNTASVSDGSTYQINVTANDAGGLSASDISDGTFTIKNAANNTGNNTSNGTTGGGGAGAVTTPTITEPAAVTSAPPTETTPASSADMAEHFFVSIVPSLPAKFMPGLTGLAVSEITFKSKSSAESVTAKIKKLTSMSVPVEDGQVYQYFELVADGLSAADLDKVVIRFEVPKSWVDSYPSVYLATLVGTGWQKLPTTKSEETASTVEYLATTSHLSAFAIVGSTKTTVFTKIETSYAIIGVLVSLIICVSFFVLTAKSKQKRYKQGPKPAMQLRQGPPPAWPPPGWQQYPQQPVRQKKESKKDSSYRREVPDFGFR